MLFQGGEVFGRSVEQLLVCGVVDHSSVFCQIMVKGESGLFIAVDAVRVWGRLRQQ